MKKKDAYYFPHDSNAKDDPKTVLLRLKFGWEGYGIYWGIIEELRNQPFYKYALANLAALNLRMQPAPVKLNEIIEYCISKESGLFASNGTHFWSKSLIGRMKNYENKCKKARRSAAKRWGKEKAKRLLDKQLPLDANALQTQCEGNALKNKVNKIKGDIYIDIGTFNHTLDHVKLTQKQKDDIIKDYGARVFYEYADRLQDYIEQIGIQKATKKYASHAAVMRNWIRRDGHKKITTEAGRVTEETPTRKKQRWEERPPDVTDEIARLTGKNTTEAIA